MTCTRPLKLSHTKILSWDAVASPQGSWNEPGAAPGSPRARRNRPFWSNTCTVPKYESAM